MNAAAKARASVMSLTIVSVMLTATLVGTSAASAGLIVPDFSLTDVNSSSTSYNSPVSPRDYLGQVSGWYFGHAT